MISINLFVRDCPKALAFYEKVFGAVRISENFSVPIGERNASFRIGESRFALADENPVWGSRSLLTLGGVPLCLQIYVPDLEKTLETALSNGGFVMEPGTQESPIFEMHDGVRFANVKDPFGFVWSITQG